MKVKDIMTWNVITVSSDTPIMEARKIMETHKVHRLPVVDKGKLVGIVTFNRIEKSSPSEATSLSIWEIHYIVSKMLVKDVMQKDVVTIDADASIEQAVAKSQGSQVGIMPVLEGGKVIGVITSTDFSFKVLHPLLGIGKPGTRLNIAECNQPKNIKEIMEILEKSGLKIVTTNTLSIAEDTPNGLAVHVAGDDVKDLVKSIEAKGYKVAIVAR